MRLLLAFLIAAGSVSAQARANSIGIYATSQGIGNIIDAQQQVLTEFYILASTTLSGITEAEFRVTGAPAPEDALLVPIANPAAALFLGDPFGDGAKIAFPACQAPDTNGNILLFTVQILVVDFVATQDHLLEIVPHNLPSNPLFDFVHFYRCDDTFGAPTQASGEAAVLNPKPLPVEGTTWSAVKQVFH